MVARIEQVQIDIFLAQFIRRVELVDHGVGLPDKSEASTTLVEVVKFDDTRGVGGGGGGGGRGGGG